MLLKQPKIQVLSQQLYQLWIGLEDFLGDLVTDSPKNFLEHLFSLLTVFLKSTLQLRGFNLELKFDTWTGIHLKIPKNYYFKP